MQEIKKTSAIMTHNGNISSSGHTPTTNAAVATGNVEERLMVCKRSKMQIPRLTRSCYVLEAALR